MIEGHAAGHEGESLRARACQDVCRRSTHGTVWDSCVQIDTFLSILSIFADKLNMGTLFNIGLSHVQTGIRV